MLGRLVTKVELITLGLGISIWVISATLPGDLALVPEYVASWNVILLISIIITVAVVARQTWLWFRWWSVAISLVLLVVASFPATLIAEELVVQLKPQPSEGFMYRGGFGICGTYVVSASASTESEERLYIMERHCIPDGLGEKTMYVRRGSSIFMRKLTHTTTES